MVHNCIRNIETVRILDESPARLAATRIATQSDVGIKILNTALLPVLRLLRNGLKKEVKGLNKASLHSWRTCEQDTPPKAAGGNMLVTCMREKRHMKLSEK